MNQADSFPVRSSKGNEGIPGRLARRFLEDLLNGRFFYGRDDPSPDFSCSALQDPRQQPQSSVTEHDLICQPNQTIENDKLEGTTLCCKCRACRYRFVVRISPGTCDPLAGQLEHHYVLEKGGESKAEAETTHVSLAGLPIYDAQYMCSVCSQRVELKVSSPLLKWEWIMKITDKERIRKAVGVASEGDPARYANITEDTVERWASTPLQTLNAYLRGVITLENPKRIVSRNKTFTAQFGDCNDIFLYLGFRESLDEETNELGWNPPRLEPQNGKTKLASMRAFLEDVRTEVQSIMEQQSVKEGYPPLVAAIAPKGRAQLEKHLRVGKFYQPSTTVMTAEEAKNIDLLGTTPDADDRLLKWAYERQVEADPARRDTYLNALSSVAAGRDMDLQLFCFAQQSAGPSGLQPEQASLGGADANIDDEVNKAFAHFNLTKYGPESPTQIIQIYKAFCDQSPAQKRDHRDQLYKIGLYTNQVSLLEEAKFFPSADEASHYLKAENSWPLESVAVLAQVAAESSEHPLPVVIEALLTIELTKPLQERSPEYHDIMHKLQEKASSGKPTQDYNKSDMGVDKVTNDADALRSPAGLGNIRNTCYLNSILQYLYTVDTVRDLVCNLDLPDIDPDTGRLPGESEDADLGPDRGQAYVGCEFVRELRDLFEQVKRTKSRSVRPRQELANAALLRANATAPASRPAEREPPALPPRAATADEAKAGADVVAETMETASVVSSQTLVDKPDDDLFGAAESSSKSAKDTAHRSKTVKELKDDINSLTVTGTDQMDVDEVMGNMFDHLQAAFKIANHGKPEAKADPIRQAFFSQWVENKRKIGEAGWTRQPVTHRWMTSAAPTAGKSDLYETLEHWLALEKRSENEVYFISLAQPAPHFHICLTRNDGRGNRVNAPVKIHETLYLDRFMHTGDEKSPLSRTRKRAWDIIFRLKELPAAQPLSGQPVSLSSPAPDARKSELLDDYLASLEDGLMTGDFQVSGYGVEVPVQEPTPPPDDMDSDMDSDMDVTKESMGEFWKTFDAADIDARTQLESELDSLFKPFVDHPYCLHAVVCHAGSQVTVGHYFVYIRDFKNACWYKFNDETVTVFTHDRVMSEITTTGQPYYLAYVDARKIDELVSIPARASADATTAVDEGATNMNGTVTHVNGATRMNGTATDVDVPMGEAAAPDEFEV